MGTCLASSILQPGLRIRGQDALEFHRQPEHIEFMDYRDSHLNRGGDYDQTLAASAFDAYMARWEAQRVEEIMRSRFPRGVERYLDFACGTGRITAVIEPHARECVGVDISATMLETARSKIPGARFVQADLTKDECSLGSFDLVSSFRFFGNAQGELREKVLGVLEGLVAPGGYLLVNNHRNPRAIAHLLLGATGEDHGMDLTHSGLKALLARFGFELMLSRPIGVWKFRGKLMNEPLHDPAREERMERIFGASFLAPVAPDTVYLFRRTGKRPAVA